MSYNLNFVSFPARGCRVWAYIGPASILLSSCIIDTPVSVSLLAIADSIGEGPRYFGSREGWTLIIPGVNKSIIDWGMIFPYATKTPVTG